MCHTFHQNYRLYQETMSDSRSSNTGGNFEVDHSALTQTPCSTDQVNQDSQVSALKQAVIIIIIIIIFI